MAEISKRGSVYQVRIYWIEDGKRKSKSKSGFKTKREAQIYAAELETLKARNFISQNSKTPFPEYFWAWFETYKESSVSERTKLTYKNAFNVLKRHLSGITIEEMDRRLYRKFIANFGKNHAKSTVSKFNSLYHACVKDAMYDGDVTKDFIEGTDIVYNRAKTRQIEYLNIEETKKLANYLTATLNHNFTAKYMILLAIATGARLGEIQALTWKDINFNFHTININKSWNETLKDFQPTKNESSKRIIRVNKNTLNYLNELKQNHHDMVFVNQYNTVPTSSAVNKTLRACLKELNIGKPSFHFHSLRHTHVAYLLSENIDLYIISKRLGHSDISTTSRVYSYLIDEYKNRADNQIENIVDKLFSKVEAKQNIL
ncbi:site-specific recombinase, phage integrase family [Ligilactobacillus agilis DSM 20509]|uniref:Site-specific recombinase, phage integrase family n=1 Tax=Ligilactobacillus agilis DSM 20509 TaxID=1423718 RepID=A0A0R2A7N4_9LACO|nr:site-specific integrase [Ligilactobacillus agilis]KRM63088.1 site-specific recombinase, phage integrase family [Ligilactobacillus agilis DSM 20509]